MHNINSSEMFKNMIESFSLGDISNHKSRNMF